MIYNVTHDLRNILPGNERDICSVEELLKNFKGTIFGDNVYISKKLFENLLKNGTKLVTKIKKNMKDYAVILREKVLLRKRSLIESVFNILKNELEGVVYISFCKNTCYNYSKYVRRGFMLHRHDISDDMIKDILPGTNGNIGRPAKDTRQFINAVLWIIRTGAPWRDLPAEYGDWKNTNRRFCRWRDIGSKFWKQ